MKNFTQLGIISFCLFISLAANAAANISFGPAAQNAMSIVGTVIELVGSVLYISSAVMFVSAFLKLRLYRQNPQQMPLVTPIAELVLAAVLGGLPFLTELASHSFAIPKPSILKQHQTGGVP